MSTALKCRAEAAGDDLAVPESRSVSLMSHLKSDNLREKCAPGSNVARLGNELRRWFDVTCTFSNFGFLYLADLGEARRRGTPENQEKHVHTHMLVHTHAHTC